MRGFTIGYIKEVGIFLKREERPRTMVLGPLFFFGGGGGCPNVGAWAGITLL